MGCQNSAAASGPAGKCLVYAKDFTQDDFDSVIAAHPAVVFSLTYCPHCRKTKDTLTKLGCPAYIIEVDNLPNVDAMKAWLKDKNNQGSFPMVFINGQLVAGNSEFQALVSSGEAQKKIAEW